MTRSASPRGTTNKRQSAAGSCQLCGAEVARARSAQHFADCAPAHDVSAGVRQELVQLRATVAGLRPYWMDFEGKADANLEAIDAFLRRLWLECCGHLSVFRIGGVEYFSRDYEFGLSGLIGERVTERVSVLKR